ARARELRINPDLGAAIGIDFGFRTVRLLVTDLAAGELARSERRLGEHYSAEEGLGAIAAMLDETVPASGGLRSRLVAAGIALPGPVDTGRQSVIGSAVLPGWSNVTAHDLESAVGVPVVLENDANLAALGEHVYGAGRGSRDSLTVKFHSGVGAGIIVGDRLVTGRAGGAGEIGHTLVDPRGPLCRCGKRGCLDTYAAVPAVLDAMSAVHPELGLPGFLDLVHAQDPGALRVARDAADLVGRALGAATLLLAPERIILVGALARAGDVMVAAVRDALAQSVLPDTAPPEVVLGELGDRHTAMGAVARALEFAGWLPMGTN
ncbi:ROK family protein, partial [Mesorhizobium japonicum]|uniref:ROK family protein n=1 Tax=Mesorhizobium japonicum TaxID=2066070 RepID=UPI003B5C85D5